jgi:hypothetical protein
MLVRAVDEILGTHRWTMLSAQEKAVWAALQLPLPATRRCADGKPFPARPGTRRNYKAQPPGAPHARPARTPQAHPGTDT